MQRKYFGTDGIRGKVGDPPITAEFMLKLGWAVGKVLAKEGGSKVIIGKDTRISGYMFESVLEAGLSAAGVDILLLGPMPTPAIAYLTRTLHANAGIVISASHNAYYDNGVKFFTAEGTKLPDRIEEAIEQQLETPMTTVESACLGKAERVADAPGRYIEFCKSTIPNHIELKGMRIVVDCAHGATYHITPKVLDELGAEVIPLGIQPDGLNINREGGSTQPDTIRQAVLSHGADVGIALDGDGDRVIMVDHKGEIVDGDELLFIIASDRVHYSGLKGTVVGTQMSNLGLQHAIEQQGLQFQRSQVGDRYVMEKLKSSGAILGGEGSGHIICLDRTTTGDGTVSALQVLAAMAQTGRSLNDLKSGMKKYPQCLVNVAIDQRIELDNNATIRSEVENIERQLGSEGRVLLRLSGTEPLVRVMIEGVDEALVDRLAHRLAEVVRKAAAA